LQTFQAVGAEAFAPACHGVAIAADLGGDVLVGRVVRVGGPQDDAAAEDQCLGCRAGTSKGFKRGAQFVWQLDDRTEGAWHGRPPGKFDQMVLLLVIMATDASAG
jgi:hypothetical protein